MIVTIISSIYFPVAIYNKWPPFSSSSTNNTELSAPVQIEPIENKVFITRDRHIEFKWEAVSSAVNYGITIEYYYYGWHEEKTTHVPDTNYIHEFIGGETGVKEGRWCVWAINNAGIHGPKSMWREFSFM